jgi:hypothetical protein
MHTFLFKDMARQIARLTAALILLVLSVHHGSSQWQRVPGPPGGSTKCFAVEGSRVIAGTAEGIYISLDSGYTWHSSNSGLLSYDIRAVVSNGRSVMALTGTCELESSDDGGTTWRALGNSLKVASVYCLVSQGPNFYAGTNWGFFRSTDSGHTWSLANGGLIGPGRDKGTYFRALDLG